MDRLVFGIIAFISFFVLTTSMNLPVSLICLTVFIPSATLSVVGLDTARDLW